MADDHDDFAEWRGNIETRMSTLEGTVEVEARTRAQMDKDMSDMREEFRIQRNLLQALAETQSEHTTMLRELGEGYGELRGDVDYLKTGHETVMAGIQTIITLLDPSVDDASEGTVNSGTPE